MNNEDIFSISLQELFAPLGDLTPWQKSFLLYCVTLVCERNTFTSHDIMNIANQALGYEQNIVPGVTGLTTEEVVATIKSIPTKYKNELIALFVIGVCNLQKPPKTETLSSGEFMKMSNLLEHLGISAWDIALFASGKSISVR